MRRRAKIHNKEGPIILRYTDLICVLVFDLDCLGLDPCLDFPRYYFGVMRTKPKEETVPVPCQCLMVSIIDKI